MKKGKAKQKKITTVKRIKRRGRYYVVTRDEKGRFRKFQKWKPVKKMWRLTVAVNYYEHHVEGSLKIQTWHTKKSILLEKEQQLTDELLKAFKERFPYPDEELWFEYKIGTEIEQVPYDKYLVNYVTPVKDETIKVHKRK